MARVGRQQDRQLMQRVGRLCSWQQALLCPCQQYDGAQGPPCAVCDRGYLYQPAQKIRALFTSDNRKERYDMAGAWEKGSAHCTVAAHIEIGDQDKLVVEDFPIRDNVILTRGATTKDTIPQKHVVDILVLRDKSTTYTKGTDFNLSTDDNGNPAVEWVTGGRQPDEDVGYTMLCTIKMVWIVDTHAFIRTLNGRTSGQLPKRVELVRWDRAAEAE